VTNVYASLILRPGGRSDDVGAVGLAVALGLCDGLDTFGVDPTIKWPNDILVAGRKLAGILCEARWTTAAPVIVAGFGINVAQDEFPPELADRAIALGPAIDPAVVLARCLDALEPVLEEFWADGFAPLRPRFERRCPWLGRAVEVELAPGERYVVRALEVDDHGALWVEHEGGEHHRICAGEIVEV
jgi:BirA family biotin operon repressor/biotin-[acetyl-CoA-carboxylase] ligase